MAALLAGFIATFPEPYEPVEPVKESPVRNIGFAHYLTAANYAQKAAENAEAVQAELAAQSAGYSVRHTGTYNGDFVQGYRDFGGNPAWLEHFLFIFPNCENYDRPEDGWYWGYELGDYFISVGQFHTSSWHAAAYGNPAIQNPTGLDDPTNVYHVGANTAVWSNAISHPGGSGGWPNCWWAF